MSYKHKVTKLFGAIKHVTMSYMATSVFMSIDISTGASLVRIHAYITRKFDLTESHAQSLLEFPMLFFLVI